MFTGIIEEKGTVRAIRRESTMARIVIACNRVLGRSGSMSDDAHQVPTRIGDSIAVNGVCLTVTELRADTFTADVMPETFRRSSLGDLRPGNPVNLERAMPADGRFGGHIVAGHVDGTGTITEIVREQNAVLITVSTDSSVTRYIVDKGSVAIDGISLTVVSVRESLGQGSFTVSVIPHTLKETALSDAARGTKVNIENDIVGKYIEKFTKGGDIRYV